MMDIDGYWWLLVAIDPRCRQIPGGPRGHCHAIVMLLPCNSEAIAKLLPCYCRAIAMLLPCYWHAVATPWPCHCQSIAMHLTKHTVKLAAVMVLTPATTPRANIWITSPCWVKSPFSAQTSSLASCLQQPLFGRYEKTNTVDGVTSRSTCRTR